MDILLKVIMKPHKAIKVGIEFANLRNLKINPFTVALYMLELQLQRDFWSYIYKTLNKVMNSFPEPLLGGWMLGYPAVVLYSLVRTFKPEIVIETGVGPGGSSALILLGLQKNGKGHLYSIDLPGNDALIYPKIGKHYNIHIPPGYDVGWLVPPSLRQRWSLIIGDSKELLPELVSKLGRVDMFLHDSLHTDDHILFELYAVFPYLTENGLLLADDVNDYWSTAFIRFCKENNIPYIVLRNRLGISRKILK